MKAYMVHDGDPGENAALVFARTAAQARKLGYLHNDIGSDGWITLRTERKPDADRLIPADVNEPYLVTDTRVLREAGWSIEGDMLCASCGLATMDGEFPLCEYCEQCAECGHADDCPPAAQESGDALD